MRRTLAKFLIIGALMTVPLAATGCGAGGHYLGGIVAQHVANHFAKTPAARRRVSKAFCVYNVYRAFHDLTHHHLIFGALNVHQALRNCEAGFGRNQR